MTDRRLSNQDRSNLANQDRSNQDRSSQDRSSQDLSGQDLSNQDLLASLTAALKQESGLLVTVITLLIKVEDRRLHLELACPSMFDFCRRRLGLSEGEAFRRITAARLAKRFPQLLDAIRTRRIHLSSVVALRDLFTAENVSELLEAVAGKSKREVEELVARRAPRPDAPTLIRRLPDTRVTPKRNVALIMASEPLASSAVAPGAGAAVAPGVGAAVAPSAAAAAGARAAAAGPAHATAAPTTAEQDGSRGSAPAARVPGAPAAAAPRPAAKWLERPHEVRPLSGSRHRVQLTVSSEVRAKLERAQSLMRHRNVDGDLAIVFERALDLLIAKLEKEKLGATSRPPKATPSRPASLPFASATSAPATSAPATSAPATSAPATSAPATSAPVTSAPVTSAPATSAPAMSTPTARSAPSTPPPARRMSPNTITAATRREVVRRDDERCAFVSVTGERCPARDFLEIDHRNPRALGGGSDATNLRLLCRAHNLHAAEQRFGRAHVERAIRERRDERHAPRQRRGSGDSPVPTQTRLPCEGT